MTMPQRYPACAAGLSFGLAAALVLAGCDRSKPADTAIAHAEARPVAPAPAVTAAPVRATPAARLLEIATDTVFSDEERALIATLEEEDRARDPAKFAQGTKGIVSVLDKYDKSGPVIRAELRHKLRATVHYQRAEIDEPRVSAIVDRHDPVLVEDVARKEVVTMADINALHASNRFVADMVGIRVPAPTEEPGERAELNRRYRADASLRTALLQASVRSALLRDQWPKLGEGRRNAVLKIIRAEVVSPETAADAARGMENGVVLAEQRRVQARRNDRALADLRRSVMGWQRVNLTMVREQGILNAFTANGL